ncbi:hypothetical protein [Modestobacter marinus]|uniref:hypothetical protein n=1 Tax=Modestobacter marinus TaxID=477641 RepID=UPI001C97871D|nr:hypothetical protein [Modestobacter marinus]
MYLIDQDLTRAYMAERVAEADRTARARRLVAARRWNRKAERASRRAARLSAAVW